jgi:DNA-directed RNA polymerase subunit L
VRLVVRKQEDRLLDLEFTDEKRTALQLLKERVLEDDKVETSTVLQDHPVLDDPRLSIRTGKGRRPETALKNAAQSLREDLDELEGEIVEALD